MNDKIIDNLIDEIAQETPNFSQDQNQKTLPASKKQEEERTEEQQKSITRN